MASLEGILEVGIRVHAFLKSLVAVFLSLTLLIASPHKGIIFLRSEFARCDVFLVLPECLAAHGAIEYLDGLQAEAGSDLNQSQLFDIVLLSEFFLMLVDHLVDPEPDTLIIVVERDHMIDEGLGLRMILRRIESLMQHFLHQLQVRGLVEGGIEGQ